MHIYTKADVGCFIDGAHGQRHQRDKLAGMLRDCYHRESNGANRKDLAECFDALDGGASDDDWETERGTDLLYLYTDDNLVWDWESGDLCLVEENELNLW